jgi:hypothetical protein
VHDKGRRYQSKDDSPNDSPLISTVIVAKCNKVAGVVDTSCNWETSTHSTGLVLNEDPSGEVCVSSHRDACTSVNDHSYLVLLNFPLFPIQ